MKPASNGGGVCGNLMLSKLCSIFQAFLVVLQTLCSESKPADSRLSFLTPPFRTLLPQLHAEQGLETTFGPSVPHHKVQHPPEAQHVGKQGEGHGAALPNLPASMPNAHGKQNKKMFWSLRIFAFALFLPRSTQCWEQSLQSCCKGAHSGDELSPAHFLDGWLWMLLLVCPPEVKARQIHCQMTPISCCLPIPLALQHSYGPEEPISTRDTWSSRYLCCVSLGHRKASQCPNPKSPLDIVYPLQKLVP